MEKPFEVAFPNGTHLRAVRVSSSGELPAALRELDLSRSRPVLVLVPGLDWGDEARWLVRLASALADGAPSVTVLVNGGDVAA
jgi:hypothetical protein